MILDESKLERQKLGIGRLLSAFGKGIFNYPPGFGKTHSGLLAISSILKDKRTDKDRVLILTPSKGVYDVWTKSITDFNWKYVTRDTPVTILRANEIHDLEILKGYTVCIIDEYHKFTSDNRVNIVKYLYDNTNYMLGLTATMPTNSKLLTTVPLSIVDYISEKEAIDNNWISNFIEYNIRLEFSIEDKAKYKEFSEPIKDIHELFKNAYILLNQGTSIFKSDTDVLYSCLYGKTFYLGTNPVILYADRIRHKLAEIKGWSQNMNTKDEYSKMIDDYWNPSTIEHNCRLYAKLVRNRNELLINNKNKLQPILKLVSSTEIPTIIFNESTDFANTLAECIGYKAIVYHSNVKSRPFYDTKIGDFIRYKSGVKKGQPKIFGRDSLRKIAINGMIDGTYKVIISARALDEGVNIPNIERVITSAGTTNPMTYAQRSGRGKRVDFYNPEKITKIYNFYFDDFEDLDGNTVWSRDKRKLIMRQKGSTNVNWVEDINELL
jgi:superfamily II DNA or RNA helicase